MVWIWVLTKFNLTNDAGVSILVPFYQVFLLYQQKSIENFSTKKKRSIFAIFFIQNVSIKHSVLPGAHTLFKTFFLYAAIRFIFEFLVFLYFIYFTDFFFLN